MAPRPSERETGPLLCRPPAPPRGLQKAGQWGGEVRRVHGGGEKGAKQGMDRLCLSEVSGGKPPLMPAKISMGSKEGVGSGKAEDGEGKEGVDGLRKIEVGRAPLMSTEGAEGRGMVGEEKGGEIGVSAMWGVWGREGGAGDGGLEGEGVKVEGKGAGSVVLASLCGRLELIVGEEEMAGGEERAQSRSSCSLATTTFPAPHPPPTSPLFPSPDPPFPTHSQQLSPSSSASGSLRLSPSLSVPLTLLPKEVQVACFTYLRAWDLVALYQAGKGVERCLLQEVRLHVCLCA